MERKPQAAVNLPPEKVIEKLVAFLLDHKPDDPIPYMIQFLEDLKGTGGKPLNPQERDELENLRREHIRLRQKSQKAKAPAKEHHDDKSSDSGSEDAKIHGDDSSDESEEEDQVKELKPNIEKAKQLASRARTSVSAEVFGKYHQRDSYQPLIIKKQPDVKEKIRNRLLQSFMFNALDDKEMEVVIDAMDEKRVKAGDDVIIQGERGNELYVVEEGQLDCFKKFEEAEEPKYLKTYDPGEAFGELALLYNAPRAATITAKTNCLLWVLDRNTFNYIVKDAAARKREKYEEFLKSVSLLQSMDHYERSKLADAIKEEKFNPEDFIIREGETGNVFYIVVDGHAVATKTLTPGQPPVPVKEYGPGEYFGELALLKGEPRAANVIAKTKLKVVSLDRNSFRRLLGPLDNILKRNMDSYINYVK